MTPPDIEIIPALIIYKGFKEGSNIIMLDKGRDHDVGKNDVIVYKDGLVGRILACGQHTCMASMIVEPDIRVSVRIDPARVYGILKWHHGNTFIIDDIPTSVEVKPGQTVTTSGFSEIYPADIPVGRITGVTSSENGFTYIIEGNYFVEFNKLREVFILRENGN
ncbi:MAG: rod shape-determining protein MreC [Candidatus Marinimicrobia bacterium]|nr:rod shape-determining protein MreC [Candidatus Neomarinimicrobiota bacterium]